MSSLDHPSRWPAEALPETQTLCSRSWLLCPRTRFAETLFQIRTAEPRIRLLTERANPAWTTSKSRLGPAKPRTGLHHQVVCPHQWHASTYDLARETMGWYYFYIALAIVVVSLVWACFCIVNENKSIHENETELTIIDALTCDPETQIGARDT